MKIRTCMEPIMQNDTAISSYPMECVEYADPLFGVGSATSAGPTLPGGSIHPSPETLEPDNGGYRRGQPIRGFGHAYTSGSGGMKCYGNFLLAPMVGEVELSDEKRAMKATWEKANCYAYAAELENGIRTKLIPTHDAAIHSFVYPQNAEASILFDAARKLDMDAAMLSGSITVNPKEKTVCGGGLFTGNWNKKEWEMFFALEFDADFKELCIFKGDEIIPVTDTVTVFIEDMVRLGMYAKFGTAEEEREVKVKVAISFKSEKRATKYLKDQIPMWDLAAAENNAKEEWRKILGAIDLKTNDKALLRRFYTAMYHMHIQPRNRTHDHGNWDDFHTLWDTWKSVFPMYSLLFPEKMGSIIDSFIDRALKNEAEGTGVVLGEDFVAGKEMLAGQGGNDADNVIADAYLKGVPLKKHTWEEAYKVLLMSAEKMRTKSYIEKGYAIRGEGVNAAGKEYSFRFKPAAATLGYAVNDKAVAAVAKELGTREEYEKYEKRSANWRNVWNEKVESEGFYGFPQERQPDGTFEDGFDAHKGYNTHFYEATGWDASYIPYNDVSRLIETMGGAETFCDRLLWACEHSKNYYNDDLGAEGYLNFTNEPSFQIPWLFCVDEIKRPDLAAKVIDGVIKRFSLQDDYPGDDDNGGMSSFYVFQMCGFFPYATTENYYLHGTRVEKIIFRLGNGRELEITGENVGEGNIYVQSCTWQGKPYNECKMTHSQIMEGGKLHFVMGNTPSDWARK